MNEVNDFTRVKLSHGVDLGTKLHPTMYPRVRARNECVLGVCAHLRFVHVPPVWLREDEYILLEQAARHCDRSTQEVATTPPHVPRGFMNCKRDTV